MAAGITGSDCGEAIIEINLPTSFWVNEIVFESQSRYPTVDNYPRNFQLYYCWDCDGFGYVPYKEGLVISTGMTGTDGVMKTVVLDEPFVARKIKFRFGLPADSTTFVISDVTGTGDGKCILGIKMDFKV